MNRDIVFDRLYSYFCENGNYGTKNVMKQISKDIFEKMCMIDPSVSLDYVQNRLKKIKKFRKKLIELQKIPVVEQRSKEWYDMRDTMITASDFGSAMGKGKFTSKKEFFRKKCKHEDVPFMTSPPTTWGVKYEEVANMIYKERNNVEVFEFGLVRDQNTSYLGASPDGINDNGIMVEYKCPFRKKEIPGQIIEQYYIQMQGQMEVCGLDECDFFECLIDEYMDFDEWIEVYGNRDSLREGSRERGIIITEIVDNSNVYHYSPVNLCDSVGCMREWMNENVKKMTNFYVSYWILDIASQVRVYRDHKMLERILSEMKDAWDLIISYNNDVNFYNDDIGRKKRREDVPSKLHKIGISAFRNL